MRDFKNTFSWSVSRHRVFTRCARQYYYRHYGSWGGWDPDADPRIREIYILKQLGNRFTLAGKVVHEAVADLLNRHRYGRDVSLEDAKAGALAALRQGFRESRDGEYRQRPRDATGLFEHEYAEDLPDAEWQKMRDRVFRCLDNFYASRIRATILDTRIEDWLPIDALDSFVFEETTVFVAPDFAVRNRHGNALVIDWKTGWPEREADRTQIVCYGLFAREKWGVDPEKAIGELHYLLTGDADIVTLDEVTLEAGTEQLRASIRDMKALLTDPEANLAEEERFSRTEDRSACARCNFRRICWPAWPETDVPPPTEQVVS